MSKIEQSGMSVLSFLTSGELKSWLVHKPIEIAKSICVISNRSRPGDGDECAGVRLCHWLKEEGSEWKEVPFMIYCFHPELVCDLPKYEGVFLTKKSDEVLKFVMSDR